MKTLKTRLYSLESAQEANDMASWPMGGQVVLPYSWASATLKVSRRTMTKTISPTQRLILMTNICHHNLHDDDIFTFCFQIIKFNLVSIYFVIFWF